jgi:hypothetical protein
MGRKALLGCGILSSLLYVAANVFGARPEPPGARSAHQPHRLSGSGQAATGERGGAAAATRLAEPRSPASRSVDVADPSSSGGSRVGRSTIGHV